MVNASNAVLDAPNALDLEIAIVRLVLQATCTLQQKLCATPDARLVSI